MDSDGDGIPDWQDLDDDNDGILDINEDCSGYLAQNANGVWMGDTFSNLTVAAPSAIAQTNAETYNDKQNKFWINQNGGQQRVSRDGTASHSFTYTFSNPVKASEIAFAIIDVGTAAGVAPGIEYTFLVNGVPSSAFVSTDIGLSSLIYNSATGKVIPNGSSSRQQIFLKGYGNSLVSSITLTSIGTIEKNFT